MCVCVYIYLSLYIYIYIYIYASIIVVTNVTTAHRPWPSAQLGFAAVPRPSRSVALGMPTGVHKGGFSKGGV